MTSPGGERVSRSTLVREVRAEGVRFPEFSEAGTSSLDSSPLPELVGIVVVAGGWLEDMTG